MNGFPQGLGRQMASLIALHRAGSANLPAYLQWTGSSGPVQRPGGFDPDSTSLLRRAGPPANFSAPFEWTLRLGSVQGASHG